MNRLLMLKCDQILISFQILVIIFNNYFWQHIPDNLVVTTKLIDLL